MTDTLDHKYIRFTPEPQPRDPVLVILDLVRKLSLDDYLRFVRLHDALLDGQDIDR